jgi:hypothetical protein
LWVSKHFQKNQHFIAFLSWLSPWAPYLGEFFIVYASQVYFFHSRTLYILRCQYPNQVYLYRTKQTHWYSRSNEIKSFILLIVIRVFIFNSFLSCPIPTLIISNFSFASSRTCSDCSTSLVNSSTSSSSYSFSSITIVCSSKFGHSFLV